VSELCFGTMNFGWTIDRETAFGLLDTYRNAGGSFLQAVHVGSEHSFLPETFRAPEEWIGDWLRARTIPRSQIVLSTRLTLRGPTRPAPVPLGKAIRNGCETTLRRLGVSFLDLMVCEWTNEFIPVDEALRTFDMLIEAGLVRHVAVANVPLWRVMESEGRASVRNRPRFEALQTVFSILSCPVVREEVREFCDSYRLGLLVTSALGGSPMSRRFQWEERGWTRGEQERLLKNQLGLVVPPGVSFEQAALAWVLSHPHVTSVVISASTSDQIVELANAASRPIDFNFTGDPVGWKKAIGTNVGCDQWDTGANNPCFSPERLQVPFINTGETR